MRVRESDVRGAATTAAQCRPVAVLVTHDLYAVDPLAFDALAREVGARLVRIASEDVEVEELASMFSGLAVALRQPRPREDEPWDDASLHAVQSPGGSFTDHHLAHHDGWTILVARDVSDGKWAAQARFGVCRDLASWSQSRRTGEDEPLVSGDLLPTKEESLAAMKRVLDGARSSKR